MAPPVADPVAADQVRAAWSAARAAWAAVRVTELAVIANFAVVVVALGAALWPPIDGALTQRRQRRAFGQALRYADDRLQAAGPLFYGQTIDGDAAHDAFRDIRSTRRMIAALARREGDHLRLKRLLQMRDVLGRAGRMLKQASEDATAHQPIGDAAFWNGEYSGVAWESSRLLVDLPR